MSDATTPTPQEILEATRQMALLARLGYPLDEGLERLDRGASSSFAAIGASMRRGDTAAQAAAAHPRLFSPFYLQMLEAAVRSPRPATVLEDLSHWLERSGRLERQLRSILLYPFLVALVMLAYTALVLFVVGPRVLSVLGPIAPSAAWTVYPSEGLALLALVALVVLLLGLPLMGRASFDTLLAPMPRYRRLRRLAYQSSWARGLAALLGAGLDVPTSLSKAPGLSTLPSLQLALAHVRDEVSRGGKLSTALSTQKRLDPALVWAAEAGEQHEQLPEALMQAADELEETVIVEASGSLRMLPAWSVVALGALTALLVLTFWWPFYTMATVITP